ncbi:MAG TPA: TonB-dependent receptor [Myxococcota bacterium]|nr:TonB-dependent receptor [Myxococcota bacterium]
MLLIAALAAPRRPVAWDSGEVVVEDQGPLDAPCATLADRHAIDLQPARANEQLLRVLPGFVTTSRYGFGGPWSHAWRGYAMGSGRDLAISVEDAPLNVPSHGLEPGMVDLTFLPRVLIDRVDVCTGGAPVRDGAFGTAGAVRLHLGLPEQGARLQARAGTDGSGSLSLAWRPRRWDPGTWLVAEVDGGEGAAGFRGWRHLRLSGGLAGSAGPLKASAFVALHDSRFDLPGFLRQSDVLDGDVRYYTTYRSWEGDGATRGLLFSGQLTRPWRWGGVRLAAYAGVSGFRLRDNVTGDLYDPVHGDGVELRQPGGVIGLRGEIEREWRLFGDLTRLDAGVDLRAWFLRVQRDRVDLEGWRAPVDDQRVQPSSLAAWTRLRLGFSRRGAWTVGVRLEQLDLRQRPAEVPRSLALRSQAWVATPEVGLSLVPRPGISAYLRWARGWRPPDVAQVDEAGRQLVDVTDTVELGVDALVGTSRLTLRGFGAWSPNEALRDPWLGTVYGQGPVRRAGGEARVAVTTWRDVLVELEGSGVDARWLDDGSVLPWVPPWTASLGVLLDDLYVKPVSVSGGLRAWVAAPRALPGGSRTVVQYGADLTARVSWRAWSFDASLDNLLPGRRPAAAGVFPSSWSADTSGSELPVLHVLPGPPFALNLGFTVRI